MRGTMDENFNPRNHTPISDKAVCAVEMCYNNNLPLVVWTVNDVNVLRSLDPYVSGILSDMIVMGKCLYDYSIG